MKTTLLRCGNHFDGASDTLGGPVDLLVVDGVIAAMGRDLDAGDAPRPAGTATSTTSSTSAGASRSPTPPTRSATSAASCAANTAAAATGSGRVVRQG